MQWVEWEAQVWNGMDDGRAAGSDIAIHLIHSSPLLSSPVVFLCSFSSRLARLCSSPHLHSTSNLSSQLSTSTSPFALSTPSDQLPAHPSRQSQPIHYRSIHRCISPLQ